jgi:hypothetical protein
MNKYYAQHAVKNISQKVLNLNDITFNKRLSGLMGLCFEVGNDFIPQNVVRNLQLTIKHKKRVEI